MLLLLDDFAGRAVSCAYGSETFTWPLASHAAREALVNSKQAMLLLQGEFPVVPCRIVHVEVDAMFGSVSGHV